jgi:hypothetical protein
MLLTRIVNDGAFLCPDNVTDDGFGKPERFL